MVYSVSNNKAFINGQNGIYDKKVANPEVKYGRNATNNYMTYVKDIARTPMPPINFEYRYIPNGQYSYKALMGNAYEELGKKTEVSVAELNQKFDVDKQKIEAMNKEILAKNPNTPVVNPDFTAEALDLNGDGKVDIAEYATSTMAADMLDGDQTKCDVKNLDGVITNKGEDASMALYMKQNIQNAKALFNEIHKTFQLDKAMNEFKSDPNNMVQ